MPAGSAGSAETSSLESRNAQSQNARRASQHDSVCNAETAHGDDVPQWLQRVRSTDSDRDAKLHEALEHANAGYKKLQRYSMDHSAARTPGSPKHGPSVSTPHPSGVPPLVSQLYCANSFLLEL